MTVQVEPEGVIDHRYASAWLYAAVRPGTDEALALVIPEGSAAAMQAFLDRFAATLPQGVHAALLLDGAGWHTADDITVPANVSLIFLPPYAPKLVWGRSCQVLNIVTPAGLERRFRAARSEVGRR